MPAKSPPLSLFIPPTMCHFVTGTWTDAPGAVAHTIAKSKAAADDTATVTIPICAPQSVRKRTGAYVTSIDVFWECLSLAMDAVTAAIYEATLPANGAAFSAPTSLQFSYDGGHDTANERLTLDQHKMTLTLAAPNWLDDDDILLIEITFNAGATSALTFFGARANYQLAIS